MLRQLQSCALQGLSLIHICGSGGGIADNPEQCREILETGLRLSRVGQVLVERCIAGWKEIEYEVMRDSAGNVITVCNMENLDPVGVHTGDSIVVAPSQTLGDKEYQMLRTSALNIISELGITGGCNVQYALHPTSFEYCVIEVNPVSYTHLDVYKRQLCEPDGKRRSKHCQ